MTIELSEVKTWGDLKEWLSEQVPSLKIRVLKLILPKVDDKKLVNEIEQLIEDAEKELLDSEEWRQTIKDKSEIKLEDLFPTLSGQEEEKEIEIDNKKEVYIPKTLIEELEGVQLSRPMVQEPYVTLTPGEYHSAATRYKSMIEEAYLKLTDAAEQPYTSSHVLKEVQEVVSENIESMAWAASGTGEESKKLRKMMLKSEELAEHIAGRV